MAKPTNPNKAGQQNPFKQPGAQPQRNPNKQPGQPQEVRPGTTRRDSEQE